MQLILKVLTGAQKYTPFYRPTETHHILLQATALLSYLFNRQLHTKLPGELAISLPEASDIAVRGRDSARKEKGR